MVAKQYLRLLSFIGLALGSLYVLESFQLLSGGTIIGAAETLIELLAVILLSRRWRANLPLLGFFGFLFIADFFYILFFYILKVSPAAPLAICLTKLPYSAAFICGTMAPLVRLEGSVKSFARASVVALALLTVLPTGWRFVVQPFFSAENSHHPLLFLFGETLDIITSTALITSALLVFLNSRTLSWSIFSVGAITLILGDWAIRHETLMGSPPTFGFYEFFWASGVFLCATLVWTHRAVIPLVETRQPSSLVNGFSMAAVSLGCLFIVLLCLSQSTDIDAIRLVSLGTSWFLVVSALLSHWMADRITSLARQLGCLVWEGYSSHGTPSSLGAVPVELNEAFRNAFERGIAEEQAKRISEQEVLVYKTRSEMARQVAHDIRSPLVALECGLSGATQLPENIRLLTRGAVKRINDIANNLLETDRFVRAEKSMDVENLATIIDSIISEKRVQYQRMKIEITRSDRFGYGLFSKCDASELRRILSNLVDNSVESIGSNEGNISIGLQACAAGFHLVEITDSGSGIQAELIPQLMKKGNSFGKARGSGLGLYHAKTNVEAWGGKVTISSKVGIGTTLSISLLRATPPKWFAPEIRIGLDTEVVILDDDESIHKVWGIRLDRAFPNPTVPRKHFREAAPFERWLKESESTSKPRLFLMDYEILGSRDTGLDLVERLGFASHSVLVTSRSEEVAIRSRCEALGLPLLPKSQSDLVPITGWAS